MCVCVCVCVCVCTSIREGFICLDQVGYQGTYQQCYVDSYTDSLHRYFRMQKLAFQLAPLSCSHTRSGQSNELTLPS